MPGESMSYSSDSEEIEIVSPHESDRIGMVIGGSAEEEEEQHVASSNPRRSCTKKDKIFVTAIFLVILGIISFATAVFRPNGLGSYNIQSSQGQMFNTYPTYMPSSYEADILEDATSFEMNAKADKDQNSGSGGGDGPGMSIVPNQAPTENSGDGFGELPPAPTPPTPAIIPFGTDATSFPVETPIPTRMPSYIATESPSSVATGVGSGEGTESPSSVATGSGSGEGTVVVSTEVTGPPTLPSRDSV